MAQIGDFGHAATARGGASRGDAQRTLVQAAAAIGTFAKRRSQ